MATSSSSPNPVLYAIQNLQLGKGSGVFSPIRSTQKANASTLSALEDISALAPAATAAQEQLAARKPAYESSLSSLSDWLTQQKASYESEASSWNSKIATTRDYISRGYNGAWYTRLNNEIAGLNAASTAYNSKLAEGKGKYEDAQKTYVGDTQAVMDALATQQKSLASAGYLAYAGPDEDAATPSPTGETLAGTELYSDTLASQMGTKKSELQSTSTPEEDILTGTMQSSLYSR